MEVVGGILPVVERFAEGAVDNIGRERSGSEEEMKEEQRSVVAGLVGCEYEVSLDGSGLSYIHLNCFPGELVLFS